MTLETHFLVRVPDSGVLKVLQIVGGHFAPPSPPRPKLSLQTPASNRVNREKRDGGGVGWGDGWGSFGLLAPFYRPERVPKPLGLQERHDLPVWSSKPN